MAAILGLIVFLVLVGGVSAGIAFLLDVTTPQTSLRKRAMIAGAGGSFLPAILPLFAVLTSVGSEVPSWIPVIALLVMALTFAVLVGFPIAYLFSKQREEKRGGAVEPETFE